MAIANNTSLQIRRKNTSTNKTSTTTITYVNPNATSENLLILSNKIIGLQASGLETTSVVKISKEVIQ